METTISIKHAIDQIVKEKGIDRTVVVETREVLAPGWDRRAMHDYGFRQTPRGATLTLSVALTTLDGYSLVNGDLNARVQNVVQQFQSQGINLDQWLQATGQDVNAFIEGLREQSVKASKVDLALRAVVVAEGLTVSDDDINAEYARIAMQVRQKASEVRKAYEKNDAVADLVSNLQKQKALDWLLEHVEVVDEAGAAINRDLLLGRSASADDTAAASDAE